jgi:hypothetical protein
MNAVEIEEAVSELASRPFDRADFAYQFLAAFGNKETTIKRLRAASGSGGGSNASDVAGGILQRSNIHLATCAVGEVDATLKALRDSPKTVSAKAKFILATDGETLQAEDVSSDDPPIACEFAKFPDHFGFFLPLAGITTVKQIRESSFDIRATGRLNKLYVELLKDNPYWATAERRPDMNHFMARLIFCFFAEDTDIFNGTGLFTAEVQKMSEADSSNTHEVISHIFLAMNTPTRHEGKPDNRYREAAGIRLWANRFPYVNGGLFSGSTEVPRFSKIARSYLINIGSLDWKKINPDIFGSMIQAVADDEERGALGMHYTSVPNILKVLNPLFLDDLRAQLEEAGDNGRKLLNLRNRMSKIRVFDPACGSGNFLVIAYKEMRAIEAVINQRRGEEEQRSDIPLTNYRGIELRDFPAEIARLALIIAEYQCDVTYRGQKEALAEFLPLDNQNWITCDNALRLDWLSLMGVTGARTSAGVKLRSDDLFGTPLDQAEIDFANEGGETYICGNPPFSGFNAQTVEQKSDLVAVLDFTKDHKYFDYVSGWLYKASKCLDYFDACAFVTTNSVVQGVQVPIIWRPILNAGSRIIFAHETFTWKNNAANNAGVFCVIIALSKLDKKPFLYGEGFKKEVENINGYLIDAANVFVDRTQQPISDVPAVTTGNVAYDGGNLIISENERLNYLKISSELDKFIRPLTGSKEFIRGERRYCIWIPDERLLTPTARLAFADRFDAVASSRKSGGKIASNYSHVPHRFYMTNESEGSQIIIPRVSSGRREFLPVGFINRDYIISDSAQSVLNAPIWLISILSSKLHLSWVSAISGKLKGDFRYSAIICYNTFPIPKLTGQNRADLTRCSGDILLAREAHFPMIIADLYDPEEMPENLRRAHDANDEMLERIYIGRRFKNDTERLEKLFELYTKMTQNPEKSSKTKKVAA